MCSPARASNDPVIGRLVDRGLDDELKGTAYAVVDGVDGRTHHIKLPDLDAAGDSAPGSIVELRRSTMRRGQRRVALAVRSDLDVERAGQRDRARPGSTGRRSPASRSRSAAAASAPRCATRWTGAPNIWSSKASPSGRAAASSSRRNLLDTLRQRESSTRSARSSRPRPAGRSHRAASGEYVAGTYRQRFALASGRFAMIDDGLGFQLVPWSPSLEKQLGQHVSGVARGDGGIDWSFGRKRGLGL